MYFRVILARYQSLTVAIKRSCYLSLPEVLSYLVGSVNESCLIKLKLCNEFEPFMMVNVWVVLSKHMSKYGDRSILLALLRLCWKNFNVIAYFTLTE